MKGNWFEKILNVLFVMAWLAIAGSIIFSFVADERLAIHHYYDVTRIKRKYHLMQ